MGALINASSLSELTRQVRAQLNCAGAMITRIDPTQQHILSVSGLARPEHFGSPVPLSHSICQHTAAMDFPLVIDDTVLHPLMHNNLAFQEYGITAYLGAPVHDEDGNAVGAICGFEYRQRRWSFQDLDFISYAGTVADGLLRQGATPIVLAAEFTNRATVD